VSTKGLVLCLPCKTHDFASRLPPTDLRFKCFYVQPVSVTTHTWYHVAFVRSGNSWYIFLNGVSQSLTLGGGSFSNSQPDVAAELQIGPRASARYLNGWLDEFRVSNGVARWTSNFAPPTARYDRDFFVVLLLHMDGGDASTGFIDRLLIGSCDHCKIWFVVSVY